MRVYLKKLRQSNDFTQQNVATLLGITQQYYNMIESGGRQQKMDIPMALKLAKAFDVSVDYILEQEAGL